VAKGADCKSAGLAFVGSSPTSPTTNYLILILFLIRHIRDLYRQVRRNPPQRPQFRSLIQSICAPVSVAKISFPKPGSRRLVRNPFETGSSPKSLLLALRLANQAFIPVSDDIIERHLRGGEFGRSSGDDFIAGVYPLMSDERCWFLAADFDKEDWTADALAVLETSVVNGVPASLERSRSGNGGHIWIFFSEPISARLARQLGAILITAAMERRPEIGFDVLKALDAKRSPLLLTERRDHWSILKAASPALCKTWPF
jgi:hypothetical protein